MRSLIILLHALSVVVFHCCLQNGSALVTRSERIWPMGGTTSVDLPQSSAFGPRRQISNGEKYDYHRGVDIPATLHSNVYAVADGTVRINGSHHRYTDGVVQLKHTNWEEGGNVYSTYIHIVMNKNGESPISLTNGESVTKGQQIAYSNRTTSLEHIHFEIRVGSFNKEHACNPWKYLPNSDNDYSSFDDAGLILTPNYNNIDCQAVVNVSVPPSLLTFNRVELHIVDSSDTPQEVRFYDFCGINTNHSQGEVDNSNYQDNFDDPSSYVIRISPKYFNSQSFGNNQNNGWGFEFVDLPLLSGGGKVMAKIFDVFGNPKSTDYANYTCSGGDTTAATTTSTTSCSGCTRDNRIWPISGSSTVDLPQSIPYGSRVYYSSGSYSFHRGVDIPAENCTDVYAVADGTVRINGSHSGYTSGNIVQLEHTNWEENQHGYIYTSYMYIQLGTCGGKDAITLTNGQSVTKGQLIAYSSKPFTSSFFHLHFEVRAGGTNSPYSTNPWKFMPNGDNEYSSFDTAGLSLAPNYNDIDCQAVVSVSVPPNLLTFNRVELHIVDSSDTPQEVRFYDMHGTNSNRTTTQIGDPNYRDDPNDAFSYLIRIFPKTFTSSYYSQNKPAEYGFEFVDLPSLSGGGKVMAKIFDVFGNPKSTDYVSYTCSGGDTTTATTTSTTSCSGCTRDDRIWPISGSSTVDLPQSIPYGSRRQSTGSYQFHRGVDIKCTSDDTPVYAVADGEVRINGSHSGYSSSIVQLKHTGWEENPNGNFYTNYQKISLTKTTGQDPITLQIGDTVTRGDIIAYSYRPNKSSKYIHFEVRAGGTNSPYSTNPWKFMPNGDNDYSSFDTAGLSLTPNTNDIDCQAVVNVSVPPNLLTFNRVELHIVDSSDTPQEVRFYDMHGTNSNRTTTQIGDPNYRDDPNDASSYLIRISPKTFTSSYYSQNKPAEYGFEFIDLPSLSGGGKVMAKIFDVFGNPKSTNYMVYDCGATT